MATYRLSSFILIFEYVEDALKVVLFALHGLQDKFLQLLIDISHYLIQLNYVCVGVSEHNLDNFGELLLEDLFDKFARSALRDRLSRLPLIGQLLLLCREISKVSIFLPLPSHIIIKEMLDELAEPDQSLTLALLEIPDLLVSL